MTPKVVTILSELVEVVFSLNPYLAIKLRVNRAIIRVRVKACLLSQFNDRLPYVLPSVRVKDTTLILRPGVNTQGTNRLTLIPVLMGFQTNPQVAALRISLMLSMSLTRIAPNICSHENLLFSSYTHSPNSFFV
jgi:hypothetical protein